MKAILKCESPASCELIENGKKTILLSKTCPKLETPFKCYIYCTSKDVHSGLVVGGGSAKLIHCCNYKTGIVVGGEIGNGKVIGEFVCDRIEEYTFSGLEAEYRVNHIDLDAMCLNHPELINYGKGEPLYGLHISDLKVYDEPKELDEFFHRECTDDSHCDTCPSCVSLGYPYEDECATDGYRRVTRPPQSWCYVEELNNERDIISR